MRRFELTDEQFARIAHLLPGKKTDPGRTAVNNRRFVDAALWILRTGSPWRDLPGRFGPWNSVFQSFRGSAAGRRKGSGRGCSRPCKSPIGNG